jgi:H+/Na+-translocating ferredoxin:NAD+ oxidoreductase subunit G
MSETKIINTTAPANSMKMLQAMVGIGIICALLIVLTFEGTLPRIKKLRAEALEKAIFNVLPGITKTSTYRVDEQEGFSAINNEEENGQVVYAGYDDNNQLVGVAVEASGQGYADILRILYGYDIENQKVIGFHVLESKETPGLGDKIEKDQNFLENFKALDVSLTDDFSSLKNKIITVKSGAKINPWEVDGITGATISSRAIGNILDSSTEHWVPKIYQNKKAFDSPKTNNEKN